MIASIFSPEFLGIGVIALIVIFGGSRLPNIARNVGSAGKEFRKAQREAEAEDEAAKAGVTVVAPPAVTAGPVVPVVAPAPAPAVPVNDDKITISKAELAALLDERMGKGETSGSTN